MFHNRKEAGQALAMRVAALRPERPVVLALPRGGVPVAAEVAGRLRAPLGLLITRKIGAPGQEELALGAVGGEPPVTYFNTGLLRELGLSEADLKQDVEAKLVEIAARRRRYLGSRPAPDLSHRTVIVVDDGIATGASVKVALAILRRQKPARVILAVPVAPEAAVEELAGEVDELVCLATPSPFVAVGAHYAMFPQVSDTEVVHHLREHQGAR